MAACLIQSFSLIISSLKQDFLINIFFYLINKPDTSKIIGIWLAVIIVAVIVPCIITFILHLIGALGINDKFCYINKYKYNYNKTEYEFYKGFQYGVNKKNFFFYKKNIISIVKQFFLLLLFIVDKNLK